MTTFWNVGVGSWNLALGIWIFWEFYRTVPL
jgi:hypothetical protein